MLKLMPFVKCLCELLTIYMHFHLLLKHVINTTFCQWAALKMDSVYYPKNYSYFPSACRRVCVCPHVTGISAVRHLPFGAAGNPMHQWRWPRTHAKVAENTVWSDWRLQEKNTSIGSRRQSLFVPSTCGESCETWWKKKTRTKKGEKMEKRVKERTKAL